ncbi:MAG: hypothetical protein WBC51_10445 [Vicinamibacterales bacterium]
MKRTTIFIDERLERELRAVARRQGQPVAALVREAVARYVADAQAGRSPRLRFVAAGRSGRRDIAERHEELLFQEDGAEGRARRPEQKRSRRIGLPRTKTKTKPVRTD